MSINIKQSINSIPKTKKFFFVGISGIGMSSLAVIIKKLGYHSSGSCNVENLSASKIFKSEGIDFFVGHKSENIKGFDCVVYTSAIEGENPEIEAAKKIGIPVIHRSEMLEMINKAFTSICITGCHGKTTTSSMAMFIGTKLGIGINSYIGGISNYSDWNGMYTKDANLFTIESDESDGSFTNLTHDFAIITNINIDHTDFYTSNDHLVDSYINFANNYRKNQNIIACVDNKNTVEHFLPNLFNEEEIGAFKKDRDSFKIDIFKYKSFKVGGEGFKKRLITFGIVNKEADYFAYNIRALKDGTLFDLRVIDEVKKDIFIPSYGLQTAINASAVFAFYNGFLGFSLDDIKDNFSSFSGAQRRFSIIHSEEGFVFYVA